MADKTFTVAIPTGSFEVQASGFTTAAQTASRDARVKDGMVVGIENKRTSSARFYMARGKVNRNMYPISPRAAAFETSMSAGKRW